MQIEANAVLTHKIHFTWKEIQEIIEIKFLTIF